jgi:hypothetical protein
LKQSDIIGITCFKIARSNPAIFKSFFSTKPATTDPRRDPRLQGQEELTATVTSQLSSPIDEEHDEEEILPLVVDYVREQVRGTYGIQYPN